MEDIGFSIGVLLAILGPVLLLPILYLLYRLGTRPLAGMILGSDVTKAGVRFTAFLLAVLLLAGVLAVSYYPGKFAFDHLCAEDGVPKITDRVRVEGYYREPLFPYQARQILEEGTFSYLEGPSPYRKGVNIRYLRSETGSPREEEATELRSRFGVRQTTETVDGGGVMTRKVIYERSTGRELARAASLVYEGGPLSLLLGVYGMSSCPDPRTPEGSRNFQTYYNLESMVLADSAAQ